MTPTCLPRKARIPEHLSPETPGAWPLRWVCGLLPYLLTSCVIWFSGQIDFWQFPLSLTFLTVFFSPGLWSNYSSKCIFRYFNVFSVINNYFQKLCFSVIQFIILVWGWLPSMNASNPKRPPCHHQGYYCRPISSWTGLHTAWGQGVGFLAVPVII